MTVSPECVVCAKSSYACNVSYVPASPKFEYFRMADFISRYHDGIYVVSSWLAAHVRRIRSQTRVWRGGWRRLPDLLVADLRTGLLWVWSASGLWWRARGWSVSQTLVQRGACLQLRELLWRHGDCGRTGQLEVLLVGESFLLCRRGVVVGGWRRTRGAPCCRCDRGREDAGNQGGKEYISSK